MVNYYTVLAMHGRIYQHRITKPIYTKLMQAFTTL